MRVPVHPNELLRNRGLKKLAKDLQKHWCGPSPLAHTSALNLIAKGFGYKSYEDLETASKDQQLTEIVPSQPEVKQSLLLAIKAGMAPSEWFDSDQAAIMQMIDSLHLRALSAFKEPKKLARPPRQSPEPSKKSEVANLRSRMAESARELSPPVYWLTEEEIKSLKRVAAATTNLRDHALMNCMIAGVRGTACLDAKPSNFFEDDGRVFFHGPHRSTYILGHEHWIPIKRYITASNLEENNGLLFPSRTDADRPMPFDLLQKFCATWATESDIEVAKAAPFTIFRAMRWSNAMALAG